MFVGISISILKYWYLPPTIWYIVIKQNFVMLCCGMYICLKMMLKFHWWTINKTESHRNASTSTARTPPGLNRMGVPGDSLLSCNNSGFGWYVNGLFLMVGKSMCTLSISNHTRTILDFGCTAGLLQIILSEVTLVHNSWIWRQTETYALLHLREHFLSCAWSVNKLKFGQVNG